MEELRVACEPVAQGISQELVVAAGVPVEFGAHGLCRSPPAAFMAACSWTTSRTTNSGRCLVSI